MNRHTVSFRPTRFALGVALALASAGTAAEQVIGSPPLVVPGPICAGSACAAGESFGFDTLKLDGGIVSVHFSDTSGGGTNDWRILVNDSGLFGGGTASYFAISDADAGTVPFRIAAGAPSHALRIGNRGNLAIGADPEQSFGSLLLLKRDYNPFIRFEQSGNENGPPYAWHMVANHGVFAVGDQTSNGYPFRIAATSARHSLEISPEGFVTLGFDMLEEPATDRLHIASVSDATGVANTTAIRVENPSTVIGTRQMLELVNNGPVQFSMADTSIANGTWLMSTQGQSLYFKNLGTGAQALKLFASGRADIEGPAGVLFSLRQTGNLTIAGTLTQGSDVNSKHDIVPLDGADVLSRLAALPVSAWTYNNDDSNARHAGPMAQDFHAVFGLGDDPTRLAPGDVAGVALAGIKELQQQVAARDLRIAELERQLAAVLARVDRVEALAAGGTARVVADAR